MFPRGLISRAEAVKLGWGAGMAQFDGAEAERERFGKFAKCCHACLKRHGFPTIMRMRYMGDHPVPAAAAAAMKAMGMMEEINDAARKGDHVNARMLSYDLADQMRIVLASDSPEVSADRVSDTRTKNPTGVSDSPKINSLRPRLKKAQQPRNSDLQELISFASGRAARGQTVGTKIYREFAHENGLAPDNKKVANMARQLMRYKALWWPLNSDTAC
jgi:hypothetical protein